MTKFMGPTFCFGFLGVCLSGAALLIAHGDTPAPSTTGTPQVVLTIYLDKTQARVSPTLYGLMTEEINHSYDGGLYAELVQNRTFQDDPTEPVHWSAVSGSADSNTVSLDASQPINKALTRCLKLDARHATAQQRIGVANDGYWGVPVRPGTTYHASFYAKTDAAAGAVTVSLESADGAHVFATGQVAQITADWKRYELDLTTGDGFTPSANNLLVIATSVPGTYWFNLVSLFPPTYHNRSNGNRTDLMDLMAAMKPTFLRLPGGNYLEGGSIQERFPWKLTLGDLATRPGHQGCWGYRSSDGMGLLDFLNWCEDLKMQPVLAVYAGYSLRGEHVSPGPDLQPYVGEALDEIEYVTGDTNTTWGAERAKDGHPAPFPLTYVEVGNEDQFDKSHSYDGRFTQFYDAIRAKYPHLQLIATTKVTSRKPDVVDDHFYRSAMQMEDDASHYDHRDRSGPKVFVGEWATRDGEPTTNLNAALGDAAWMTGMERNSDLVVMASYAPLFVNVNPGGMEWKSNLIGFDALSCFGSPSYYAQKMFNNYLGDVVLPIASENIPTQMMQPPTPKDKPVPPLRKVPTLFCVATRSASAGEIYLKLVNTANSAQIVHLHLQGAASIKNKGTAVELASGNVKDTNTLSNPQKVVPAVKTFDLAQPNFDYTLKPYSITVLILSTQP